MHAAHTRTHTGGSGFPKHSASVCVKMVKTLAERCGLRPRSPQPTDEPSPDTSAEEEKEVQEFTTFAIDYIRTQERMVRANKEVQLHCATVVNSTGTRCIVMFASDVPMPWVMNELMPAIAKDFKFVALTRDSYYCPPECAEEYVASGSPPLAKWPKAKECFILNMECDSGGIEAVISYSRDQEGAMVLDEASTSVCPYGCHKGLLWYPCEFGKPGLPFSDALER